MKINDSLTVIIPVRIDSDARMSNLTAVVRYYTQAGLTLLIIEADRHPRVDFREYAPRVSHTFVADTNPIFHRTKYINMGLRAVATPHAAVIDADVVVPLAQLSEADRLLSADRPMVLPYDGRFVSMPQEPGDAFRNTASFAVIRNFYESHVHEYMFGHHSVGGAYLVDVAPYRQCGGENEHFAGWGPEDFERAQRMDILGHPVRRIPGVIYHLNHPRGINSGNSPFDLALSTRREYCKICRMTADELKIYISMWPGTK